MKWLAVFLFLLCFFPPSPQAQVHFEATLEEALDSADEAFRGDHVIILSDSSGAFQDFEANMLQDPEVWKYLNDNYAAYRTDAKSNEADEVRLRYTTHVRGMLMIIAAPRLDNLTVYIGPSCPRFTKDILMKDLTAIREAMTVSEAVEAMK
jgi:hypothetical protein